MDKRYAIWSVLSAACFLLVKTHAGVLLWSFTLLFLALLLRAVWRLPLGTFRTRVLLRGDTLWVTRRGQTRAYPLTWIRSVEADLWGRGARRVRIAVETSALDVVDPITMIVFIPANSYAGGNADQVVARVKALVATAHEPAKGRA